MQTVEAYTESNGTYFWMSRSQVPHVFGHNSAIRGARRGSPHSREMSPSWQNTSESLKNRHPIIIVLLLSYDFRTKPLPKAYKTGRLFRSNTPMKLFSKILFFVKHFIVKLVLSFPNISRKLWKLRNIPIFLQKPLPHRNSSKLLPAFVVGRAIVVAESAGARTLLAHHVHPQSAPTLRHLVFAVEIGTGS